MANSFDATWAPGDILTAVELNKVGKVVLQEFELASATATIDFTSIPQTYSHLQIIAMLKSDQAAAAKTYMRMNGDAGANYVRAAGAAVNQIAFAAGSELSESDAGDHFTAYEWIIPNYTSGGHNKNVMMRFGAPRADGTNPQLEENYAAWVSLAAITRVTLLPSTGNFDTDSLGTLYGLKEI